MSGKANPFNKWPEAKRKPCARCGKIHKGQKEHKECAKAWRKAQGFGNKTTITDSGDE